MVLPDSASRSGREKGNAPLAGAGLLCPPLPGFPSLGSIPAALAASAASPALPSGFPFSVFTPGPTPLPSPTGFPCSSSSRRRQTTAVQPLWEPSVAERVEMAVSTEWKVALRRWGMEVSGVLERLSRRCCGVGFTRWAKERGGEERRKVSKLEENEVKSEKTHLMEV